jgi:hypothetical protein
MRERILAFLVLGLFAAALPACGVGAATDEENVSKSENSAGGFLVGCERAR